MRTRAIPALLAAAIAARVLFAFVFLRHPLSAMVPEDTEAYRTLARALVAGEWAHPAFAYLGPFYAFVLAPLAGLAPAAERLAVVGVQTAMDAASIALLCWIGARLFGRGPGLVAGAIYAAHGIAIYYCAILLPVTAMVLLTLLPIAACLAVKARPVAWWAVPGAAVGVLALVRPNAVVLLPVLWLWTLAAGRALALRRGAAMAAGTMLVLAPFALRSWAAGSGPSPFPVNGGINFYIGNHAAANGMYVSVEHVSDLPLQQVETSIAEASRRAGRPLDARSASRFWFEQGLAFLRGSPAAAARLTLAKAAMVFRAEEIPLNTNYTFARKHVPVLRATLGFGLILPLALAGIVAVLGHPDRRRDPDVWLPLWAVIAYAGTVTAFFVSDRYRIPIVPLLALFAAHGGWTLASGLRQRRARTLPLLGMLALGALAVNYPFPAFTYPEYAKDYFQLGKVYRERGQADSAVALYERAAALSPEEPEALVELASAYYFAGRLFEAEMALRTALQHHPGLPSARRNLAVLLKDQGLFDEAAAVAVDDAQRAAITRAREDQLRKSPDRLLFAQAEYERAVRRYGERQLGDARYAFKRVVAADPRRDAAWFALALVAKDLRLGPEACEAITRAAALKPQDAEYDDEKRGLCGR